MQASQSRGWPQREDEGKKSARHTPRDHHHHHHLHHPALLTAFPQVKEDSAPNQPTHTPPSWSPAQPSPAQALTQPHSLVHACTQTQEEVLSVLCVDPESLHAPSDKGETQMSHSSIPALSARTLLKKERKRGGFSELGSRLLHRRVYLMATAPNRGVGDPKALAIPIPHVA